MNICVTGGAGYIGSFIVRRLCERGHRVTVVDNLAKGHRQAVDRRARFVRADCGDRGAMSELLAGEGVEAVIHMAAWSLVGESVSDPGKYYANNVGGSLALLEAMRVARVGRIVVSSTAAVYGEPAEQPITETCPPAPINPYGASKLMVERMIADFAAAHGIGGVALRYFNVAGAAPDGSIGEDHNPETHLIPIVLAAAAGRREAITVFGDDYPTADGTCVRDYIHVIDLAEAHVLAVEAVTPGELRVFNLGNGSGFSVMQVIEAAERVVGRSIPRRVGSRRAGDPPVLVASSRKISGELNWRPQHADLERIVADAWAFHQRFPNGYCE